MRIAQIAPIYLPLPPADRGGTEMIVTHTTNELVRQGHNVTLFASGDSRTKAKLRYLFLKSLRANPKFEKWGARVSSNFTIAHAAFALGQAKNFDILHAHFNDLIPPLSLATSVPMVVTYHNPIKPRLHKFFVKNFPNCHFVSISNALRGKLTGFAATVYNGLDLNEVTFNDQSEDYLITCGRVNEDKGAHHAIAVAKETKSKLLIVGKAYGNIKRSQQYYEEKVAPYVDQKQIRLEQTMPHTDLLKAMGKARAFLFPLEWDEPFGLVMIEAMAAGTPVIAFQRGAVPEVVKDGVTGFIVKDEEEMIAALGKIDQIDRAACRKHVEDNFSIERTTRDYVAIYKKVISQSK